MLLLQFIPKEIIFIPKRLIWTNPLDIFKRISRIILSLAYSQTLEKD